MMQLRAAHPIHSPVPPGEIMHRDTRFESLENRVLLSSVVLGSHGVLRVTGDDNANDVIRVGLNDAADQVSVVVNDAPVELFAKADVKLIVVRGLGGNDDIAVDITHGQLGVTLRAAGGSGDDRI